MRKGRAGRVPSVGDNMGVFSGPGFVVYDETGKPALTLGYLYESEAETARAHIADALANAAYVARAGA
jgi:hypothetical protein